MPLRSRRCAHVASLVEPLECRRLLAASVPLLTAQALATGGAARQVEALDRGVVAVNKGTGNVYVGWRLLGTDPSAIAFNVYRSTNGAAAVKRNASPITATTNFNDPGVNLAADTAWFVRPVLNDVEQAASESFALPANSAVRQFLNIPLVPPPGG